MINEHHFSISRTARLFSIGEVSPQTRCLVIACHGYGQLAKHFIRKFDVIARDDTVIVAPEGLSRFYWGGLSGNVVASWMTKEDRLAEIEDFSNYLSQVYDHFTKVLPASSQIVLLGFSQGYATQVRWMVRKNPQFSRLVLWAGSIPEDIDYSQSQSYFYNKPLHFVNGDEDPFLTPERLEQQSALIQKIPKNHRTHVFSGKHVVDRSALATLFEEIRP